MPSKIDNRNEQEPTGERRFLKAQLDAANDMWGYFKRLAAEKADTNETQRKQIARLKKNTKALQVKLQAIRKDRDALQTHADALEFRLSGVLASRTWRVMEPVRIVGRWLRAIIAKQRR